MIRVTLKTTKNELHQMAIKVAQDIRRQAIRILQRAGEEAVNEARSRTKEKDWQDQTTNLRSSIGYVIAENGEVIGESDFKQEKETATEGPEVGRAYAAKLAHETKGLCLIVVAGMNYAKYVADKGYNVLSSSQILAEMRIPQLFEGMANHNATK